MMVSVESKSSRAGQVLAWKPLAGRRLIKKIELVGKSDSDTNHSVSDIGRGSFANGE